MRLYNIGGLYTLIEMIVKSSLLGKVKAEIAPAGPGRRADAEDLSVTNSRDLGELLRCKLDEFSVAIDTLGRHTLRQDCEK